MKSERFCWLLMGLLWGIPALGIFFPQYAYEFCQLTPAFGILCILRGIDS